MTVILFNIILTRAALFLQRTGTATGTDNGLCQSFQGRACLTMKPGGKCKNTARAYFSI
jgi:hypothetical protein